MNFLESLAMGLRQAGGVLSPGVFRENAALEQQDAILQRQLMMDQIKQRQSDQAEQKLSGAVAPYLQKGDLEGAAAAAAASGVPGASKLSLDLYDKAEARKTRSLEASQRLDEVIRKNAQDYDLKIQQLESNREIALQRLTDQREKAAADEQYKRDRMALDAQYKAISAGIASQANELRRMGLDIQLQNLNWQKSNEPLVEISDPSSPTGVRMVKRSEAAGQPAPPKASGRLNESEAKGALFYSQMQSANNAIQGIVKNGFNPVDLNKQVDVRLAANDLGNFFASSGAQQYQQAAEQWAEAYLRLKTGAATNKDEIRRNAKAYFPMPGDKVDVVIQKNSMRKQAEQDVGLVAGRGKEMVDQRNAAKIPTISTDDEYNALPSQSEFIGPDGVRRRKP